MESVETITIPESVSLEPSELVVVNVVVYSVHSGQSFVLDDAGTLEGWAGLEDAGTLEDWTTLAEAGELEDSVLEDAALDEATTLDEAITLEDSALDDAALEDAALDEAAALDEEPALDVCSELELYADEEELVTWFTLLGGSAQGLHTAQVAGLFELGGGPE